ERDPIAPVLNQPNPSEPFFPAVKNPRVPYESKVIVAAYFASRENNHTRHDKVDIGHRMDITLAPGMRYTRYFEPRGAWCYRYKDLEGELKNGYIDAEVGPKDPFSDKRYGSGVLAWQPDLGSGTNEYRAGVWLDENIAQDARGLSPAAAGKPAWSVFRVRLPYVIVGFPSSWTEHKPVGAAVVSAKFARTAADTAAISVSTDGGRMWKTAWKSEKEKPGETQPVVDLSEFVEGRYEYLVRFEMQAGKSPAGCRLDSVAIQTQFQLNPATLPAVRDGHTKMRFALGDETEVTELVPDLMTGEGFLRDVQQIQDIAFRPGRLSSRGGRTGEIIYELTPPKPGLIRGVGIVAGCRREPTQLNYQDETQVWLAENEPKGWKLVAASDVPPYAMHWSHFLSAQPRCGPDTKRVFVKFTVKTVRSASIQFIRMRLYWQPGQAVAGKPLQLDAPGLPVRGVRIEHGWVEGGTEKRFETTIKDAPAEYAVEAGKGVVNKWVTIEPIRDPSLRDAWRANDPPVAAPKLPKPQLVDVKLRDEMATLCRQIDQDPAKYLPKAAASKIEWLVTGAREALAMFKTQYPLPEPKFGAGTLARAARLLAAHEAGAASAPAATADDAEDVTAPVTTAPDAMNANKLFACLQATQDRGDRSVLAAALVLQGDQRGIAPLAEALKGGTTAATAEPAAVLLKAGVAAGRQVARTIMVGPDTYLKLRFLDCVEMGGLPAVPDELLVGLTDPSQWVRQSVLRLCRGQKSANVGRLVARVAKDDPAQFLREEAAGMLNR
ncbi:MAG: hypothetical protein PHU85_08870, partial [Phycisphaerae bacterium]|nr:hypothetical protein [Phycisphaerae bacterium]